MASQNKQGVASVPGVFKYNENTREELLRRIYWKDKQYTEYGDGLAEYVSLKDRTVSPITGGKTLFDFTHDRQTDYSNEIFHKYDIYRDDNFEVKPYDSDLQKWNGSYPEIFTPLNQLSEVAGVKFSQAITFNDYATKDRHVEEKYLTPGLQSFYGSNVMPEGNVRKFSIFANTDVSDSYATLSGIYNRESGRIPDIDEANVKIIHDYSMGEPDLNNGGNIYLEEQIREHSLGFMPSNLARYSNDKLSDEYNFEEAFSPYREGSNDNSTKNEYDEGDIAGTRETRTLNSIESDDFNTDYDGVNILSKTNELFKTHKISTLVGRFHTSNEINSKTSVIDTAKHPLYGNSHGRNLVKKNPDLTSKKDGNGYENPYCRVWTYHHQYDRLSRQIRPFMTNEANAESIEDIQVLNNEIRAHSLQGNDALNGGKYLAENTVLGKSGFVNVAPSTQSDMAVEIKKCMFSIENLAWKDVLKKDINLSREQVGPNGGRIMWFPPYDLDFQENVNVDWEQNDFIGRGEKVYTYRNTQRQGTLTFSLLIDHPGVIDVIKNKTGNNGNSDEDSDDILRFFAGCWRLQNFETESIKTETSSAKDGNSDEGKQAVSGDKTKMVRFYVYYPNNYSGNKLETTQTNWEQNGPSESAWYQYLLWGKGTLNHVSPSDPKNGYEMTTEGLGDTAAGSEITPNQTRPQSDTKCYQWVKQETKAKDGTPKYNYAVDFDLRQVLWYDKNYKDTKSFKLNSVLDKEVSLGATHSFAEVIAALKDTKENAELVNYIGECGVDLNKARQLGRELMSSKIVSITAKGAATEQDSKERKNCGETNAHMLARRRAKSICSLLKEVFKGNDIKYSDGEVIPLRKMEDITDVNSKEAKAMRYAVVEIVYNPPQIEKLSEADNADNNGNSGNISENKEVPQDVKYYGQLVGMDDYQKRVVRYETEAEYFDKLSKGNDSVIFKNLKQKFKYFTPAFHSISPEGFNARLTFLHQCTRQGHTIENANTINGYRKTAGNLAFGRMPVCVLRIGDFLNTRILIQSMAINYGKDGIQWDLNPEGAGVQPMYAQVSLGIVILGGQSLAGPISRLQNAVSFNYYANTGVYDNRADRVNIKNVPEIGGPEEEYTHLWTPVSPSDNN